jgi:hypothetical protein
MDMANESSVPISWILLFIALALGVGALALSFISGSMVPSVVVPPLI